MKCTLRGSAGFTLLEMLIAVFITGAVAAAGFNFYVSMHNTTLSQQDISDMQQVSRSCLDEIAGTLRMAGYKLPAGSAPYRIANDSLYVFYSKTKPVDTVLYYLRPNPILGQGAPDGWKPQYLMKKMNSDSADIYADVLRSITCTKIDTATFEIAVTAQTQKADEAWKHDRGYRSFTSFERVTIRNLAL